MTLNCNGWYGSRLLHLLHSQIIHIQINTETQSTIMTNEHISLEKYTSNTLFERVAKGLCVRGELETELTSAYWPPVLLSHSAGLLNQGSWGPKPSAGNWFSLPRTATRNPTNWLQLTRTVCGTGLYNWLTPTYFLWASHQHRIQPVHRSRLYLDVFDRMHLFLDWRLGRRSICYTLTLHPGSLRPRKVVSDRAQSMGQIELFHYLTVCKQMTDVKLNG